jgi:hypothetical protein
MLRQVSNAMSVIIGVDNDEPVCELSSPTISSVAINHLRIFGLVRGGFYVIKG